jgi:uncharacterized RDD family membrane protein YckC
VNAPVRRLLAFGIDYVVIAAYLLILATASVLVALYLLSLFIGRTHRTI